MISSRRRGRVIRRAGHGAQTGSQLPSDPRLDDAAAFALETSPAESQHDAVGQALDQVNCDPEGRPYIDRTDARLILDDLWKTTAPHLPYNGLLPKRLQPLLFARILHQRFGAHQFVDLISVMKPQATQTADKFLHEVGNILKTKDGERLQDYLVFEPQGGTYPPIYTQMIGEIRESFPRGTEDALEEKCSRALPELLELEDGSSWSAFIRFIAQYFCFLRDLDVQNLATKQMEAYNLLSELVQKCTSALGHGSMGIVLLPTVLACSRMLATLAITLDKRPELLGHLQQAAGGSGGEEKQTLGERAVDVLRGAFVTCLNDRSGSPDGIKDGKPEGKRVGIYKIANLCLKILFQSRRSRSAETIFTNIHNQSPPLAIYPWPERVTYLFYLGRFHFSNSHFYRAQLALQAAYDQCSSERLKQRRMILIYLITSNMILGRFPSEILFQQPEAAGLRERFQPICRAIATGDLCRFRQLTDIEKGEHADWFLYFRILLQITNRCEVLVWRSLIRRTFVLHGDKGDVASRKAPTVDLQDLVVLGRFLEKKYAVPEMITYKGPGQRHPNWAFMSTEPAKKDLYIDPDFRGVQGIEAEFLEPDMDEVECIVASLISQGLLGGFISHRQSRFAITGAKRKGALAAGFPTPWQVVKSRNPDDVPGWKQQSAAPGGNAFGGARVVRLAGAAPVGTG
ncbi:uncharacterized protein IWZ02DRAFT_458186 [Phyllosticta citriasiana]|uniref:uncharacterized protein n=1 Tax=Phyllosticta citriasiana TaxID=595635 RepID=UPI0030FD3F78